MARQHGREGGLDRGAAGGELAAHEEVGRRRLGAGLVDGSRGRRGGRASLRGLLEAGQELTAVCRRSFAEEPRPVAGLDPAVAAQELVDELDLGGPAERLGLVVGGHGLVEGTHRQPRGEPVTDRLLDPEDLGLDRGDLAFPGCDGLLVASPLRHPRERDVVAEPRRGEEGLEPVEVGLADRVELMIMASRTADGQAEEDEARGLGDVIQGILPPQPLVVEVDHVGIAAVEAGRDQGIGIVGGELIPGELEADEPVVGQVAVQAINNPVAVPPGIGPGLVELEAVGVGVARQVEPVLGPPHAELRARQQAVDDLLVSVGRGIAREYVDLGRRRRQAGQVEAQAAEQGRTVGLGRGAKALRIEPRHDERVDRVADPGTIPDGRDLRPLERLERPVGPLLRGDRLLRDRGIVGDGHGGTGEAEEDAERAGDRAEHGRVAPTRGSSG